MYLRNCLAALAAATVLSAAVTTTSGASAKEITIGTMAPQKSPWGKVFDAWTKAVEKKSGGSLKLHWYYNGQQGDEAAMVNKMRAGQLDGAAVTSVGLAAIYKPIIALQMPGLFGDWATLDRVREALLPDFQKAFNKEGMMLVGTGDVGLAHTMSKGKPIKAPEDLKTMKVYAWADDPIMPVTASVIGFTPVLSSVPSLLPKLSAGQVNVITVPSLPAVSLQWMPHLDHVTDNVLAVGVGGLVFGKGSLDGLAADQRDLLTSTGKKAGEMLTERIRKEDDKAYDLIKKKMKVITLTAGEKATWEKLFVKVRHQLSQGTFPAALVTKLESLAGKKK